MVVKTEVCYFSENKIFPGHGSKFVRKDGRLLSFVDNKSACLYHQKKKAAQLRWTQTWRRNHKKSKVEAVAKKKSKRSVHIQRAVGGISLDELKKRKAQKPDVRQAAREAALREIKERNRKVQEDKKKAKAKAAVAVNQAPKAAKGKAGGKK